KSYTNIRIYSLYLNFSTVPNRVLRPIAVNITRIVFQLYTNLFKMVLHFRFYLYAKKKPFFKGLLF
ncbi:hypothetical protein D7095_01490, partial [Listeria monocytogenes]|nr:hypothetical protein [Listeria monocytogenes]